jgi:hypothetical protein
VADTQTDIAEPATATGVGVMVKVFDDVVVVQGRLAVAVSVMVTFPALISAALGV